MVYFFILLLRIMNLYYCNVSGSVIDGQIETMLQQAKDVEVRINKLSERLHLAQRVRQQTKYKVGILYIW